MPAPKRPRLDAVLRHIENGSYDDEIDDLQSAILDRQKMRQEQVRKMVKQVYGEDYDVSSTTAPRLNPDRPNPFLYPKQEESEEWSDPETQPSPLDEWAKAEERAKAQEEALRTEQITEDDVSNSPIIGAIDVLPASTEDQQ